MKTQEELRADLQRFLRADMLDEAEAVLDLLEPKSDEEWHTWLDSAPLDDEPLSPDDLERLAAYDARRARREATKTG